MELSFTCSWTLGVQRACLSLNSRSRRLSIDNDMNPIASCALGCRWSGRSVSAAPASEAVQVSSLRQELSRCSRSAAGGAQGRGISVRFHLAADRWERRSVRRDRARGSQRGAADPIPDRLRRKLRRSDSRRVALEVPAGSVTIGEALDRERDVLAREAYRIELAPERFASSQTPRRACSMASRRWYSC